MTSHSDPFANGGLLALPQSTTPPQEEPNQDAIPAKLLEKDAKEAANLQDHVKRVIENAVPPGVQKVRSRRSAQIRKAIGDVDAVFGLARQLIELEEANARGELTPEQLKEMAKVAKELKLMQAHAIRAENLKLQEIETATAEASALLKAQHEDRPEPEPAPKPLTADEVVNRIVMQEPLSPQELSLLTPNLRRQIGTKLRKKGISLVSAPSPNRGKSALSVRLAAACELKNGPGK